MTMLGRNHPRAHRLLHWISIAFVSRHVLRCFDPLDAAAAEAIFHQRAVAAAVIQKAVARHVSRVLPGGFAQKAIKPQGRETSLCAFAIDGI